MSRRKADRLLLVIEPGTALCGLMNGLSVGTVPRERTGIATGIFSTMRVAGEGVVLALAAALLAGIS